MSRKPKSVGPLPSKNRNRRHLDRNRVRARIRDGCTGKKRFDSADAATSWAVSMVEAGRVKKLGVYLCEKGLHYHVSKRVLRSTLRVVEAE